MTKKRVLVPIAQGSCEYQTISYVTVLGRCGLEVKTACINGDENRLVKLLLATLQADMTFDEALKEDWDCIVLPGGVDGPKTMRDCPPLIELLKTFKAAGKLVGASGFTPALVLSTIPNFLEPGATCFPLPHLRQKLPQPATDYDVVWQDNVVTTQGIGPSVVFSLFVAELLVGTRVASKIANSILVDRGGKSGFRYFSSPRANPPKQNTTTTTATAKETTEAPTAAAAAAADNSAKSARPAPQTRRMPETSPPPAAETARAADSSNESARPPQTRRTTETPSPAAETASAADTSNESARPSQTRTTEAATAEAENVVDTRDSAKSTMPTPQTRKATETMTPAAAKTTIIAVGERVKRMRRSAVVNQEKRQQSRVPSSKPSSRRLSSSASTVEVATKKKAHKGKRVDTRFRKKVTGAIAANKDDIMLEARVPEVVEERLAATLANPESEMMKKHLISLDYEENLEDGSASLGATARSLTFDTWIRNTLDRPVSEEDKTGATLDANDVDPPMDVEQRAESSSSLEAEWEFDDDATTEPTKRPITASRATTSEAATGTTATDISAESTRPSQGRKTREREDEIEENKSPSKPPRKQLTEAQQLQIRTSAQEAVEVQTRVPSARRQEAIQIPATANGVFGQTLPPAEVALAKTKTTRKRKRVDTRFRKAVTAALAATDGVKMEARVPKAMEERLAATIANPESETAARQLQPLEKEGNVENGSASLSATSTDHAAATKIQTVARGKIATTTYKQYRAARCIQAAWRGKFAHIAFMAYLAEKHAATLIQSAWRGFVGRRDYDLTMKGILVVQKMARRLIASKRVEGMRRERGAINIQRCYRGHQGRVCAGDRRAYLENERACQAAATNIQRSWRGYNQQQKYRSALAHAVRIQAVARGMIVRDQLAMDHAAATKIQTVARGKIATTAYKQYRAARCIQAAWRGKLAHIAFMAYLAEKRAATLIQSAWRGFVGRRDYDLTMKGILVAQKIARCLIASKRVEGMRRERGAINIQRCYRGHQGRVCAGDRRAYLENERACQAAATDIQRFWRGYDQQRKYWSTIAYNIQIQSVARESSGTKEARTVDRTSAAPDGTRSPPKKKSTPAPAPTPTNTLPVIRNEEAAVTPPLEQSVPARANGKRGKHPASSSKSDSVQPKPSSPNELEQFGSKAGAQEKAPPARKSRQSVNAQNGETSAKVQAEDCESAAQDKTILVSCEEQILAIVNAAEHGQRTRVLQKRSSKPTLSSALMLPAEVAIPKTKTRRKRKRVDTRFRKAVTAALAATDGVKVEARVPKAMEERLAATIANPESETATLHLQAELAKRPTTARRATTSEAATGITATDISAESTRPSQGRKTRGREEEIEKLEIPSKPPRKQLTEAQQLQIQTSAQEAVEVETRVPSARRQDACQIRATANGTSGESSGTKEVSTIDNTSDAPDGTRSPPKKKSTPAPAPTNTFPVTRNKEAAVTPPLEQSPVRANGERGRQPSSSSKSDSVQPKPSSPKNVRVVEQFRGKAGAQQKASPTRKSRQSVNASAQIQPEDGESAAQDKTTPPPAETTIIAVGERVKRKRRNTVFNQEKRQQSRVPSSKPNSRRLSSSASTAEAATKKKAHKGKRVDTRFRKAVAAALNATDGVKVEACVPKAMEERLAATIANPESEMMKEHIQGSLEGGSPSSLGATRPLKFDTRIRTTSDKPLSKDERISTASRLNVDPPMGVEQRAESSSGSEAKWESNEDDTTERKRPRTAVATLVSEEATVTAATNSSAESALPSQTRMTGECATDSVAKSTLTPQAKKTRKPEDSVERVQAPSKPPRKQLSEVEQLQIRTSAQGAIETRARVPSARRQEAIQKQVTSNGVHDELLGNEEASSIGDTYAAPDGTRSPPKKSTPASAPTPTLPAKRSQQAAATPPVEQSTPAKANGKLGKQPTSSSNSKSLQTRPLSPNKREQIEARPGVKANAPRWRKWRLGVAAKSGETSERKADDGDSVAHDIGLHSGGEASSSSEVEWGFDDDTTREQEKCSRTKAATATQTSVTDISAEPTLPSRTRTTGESTTASSSKSTLAPQTNRKRAASATVDPPAGVKQGEESCSSSEDERGFDDDTTTEPAKRPRMAADLDCDAEIIASLPGVAVVTQEDDPALLKAQQGDPPLPSSETAIRSHRLKSKVFDVEEIRSIENAYD